MNPQSSANLVNSAEKFRGPMSKITVSGIPEVLARSNLPRGRILVLSIRIDRFLRFGMDALVTVKESWALHD